MTREQVFDRYMNTVNKIADELPGLTNIGPHTMVNIVLGIINYDEVYHGVIVPKDLISETPNDQELGEKVRRLYNEHL